MTDTHNEAPVAKKLAEAGEEIGRCLFAAQRKIEIARYHFDELEKEASRSSKQADLPPIPVQAHFEGVLVSIVAAEEKVKEAVRFAYRVDRHDQAQCQRAYEDIADKVPLLGKWHSQPLLADIREVRNLAIHKHYEKLPVAAGGPTAVWEVDKPGQTKYEGPRELKAYADNAVKLGATLNDLIPPVERQLRKVGAPKAR